MESITLEQAQAKLEQQRKEKGVKAPEPVSIEKECEERLKQLKPRRDEDLERIEAKIAAERRESLILRLQSNWNAPLRHLGRTEFVNPQWMKVRDMLISKLGSGFLVGLVGVNGPGKTQLGVEVMRYSVEKRAESARYHTAMEIFMRIKATYRKDADDTEQDILNALCLPYLLVIDEAGKRADTNWENNVLFELVDRRYREMRDTILISNQTVAEFTAGIGSGLTSRLNETGGLIEANWGSFRDKH